MSVYNDPRRLRSGYYNLGHVNIPVIPLPTILTDRVDGTQWLISWDDVDGPDATGRITITNDLSARNRDGVTIFPAFEGPILLNNANGYYRLFLSGHNLGIEFTTYKQGEERYNSPPVYARKSGSLDRRQLIVLDGNPPTMAFTVDQDKT